MPIVKLGALRSIILRGLTLEDYQDFEITQPMLKDYPLILGIYDVAKIRSYKDFQGLPGDMVSSDGLQYSVRVEMTWEYPQGCGRVRGYDEWPRNAEGKVEVQRNIFNQAYLDLFDEITRFENWMMTQPREPTAHEQALASRWDSMFR